MLTTKARHIKEQIERAAVPRVGEYTFSDEITTLSECRNSTTHEPTFVFDPAYSRVFFAEIMNRRNPNLKLPEREPGGDWLVAYDVGDGVGCTGASNCKGGNTGGKTCK